MLFNSHIFIFIFLPITLVLYYSLGTRGYLRSATFALVLASLFFYACASLPLANGKNIDNQSDKKDKE